jgi:hypothetical protein
MLQTYEAKGRAYNAAELPEFRCRKSKIGFGRLPRPDQDNNAV